METIGPINITTVENKSRKHLWDTMYKCAEIFKRLHGHCNVPRYYVQHPKLGAWVQTQRTQYRLSLEGKHNNMYPDRIEKLNALEFDWSPRGRHEIAWDERISQLKEFKIKYGNCLVPRDFSNQQLAHWVANQRRQFVLFKERKTTSLSEKRISILNDMGFAWKTNGTRGRKPKSKCQQIVSASKPLRDSQNMNRENSTSNQFTLIPSISDAVIAKNILAGKLDLNQHTQKSQSKSTTSNEQHKWLCDFCKEALFQDYEEACIHEKHCYKRPLQTVSTIFNKSSESMKPS